ncbi:hypothetical protein MWU75_07580 [Ornithinimicrobium sp. F0845]|uniref:hypothetical protein n=1 Tax=Ornithinimicrobium sp. F0845 TaxID=2926412 RepID=UPI001FF5FA90|nr:hypothetical protein [Ornithinimicrobium sp. F0845]MCK0111994.1 hypothetical protein [Ornithinimicrobium sp. F0845]
MGAAVSFDGSIITYVVYHFPHAAMATQARPMVEASWLPDAENRSGLTVASLTERVIDVKQRDNLLTVTLEAGSDGRWLAEEAGRYPPLACWQDR